MKPALLCMLGFFLLSSLLHGLAEDHINQTTHPVDVTDPDANTSPAENKATLTADITTIPPGGSVTLTCSADKPAGLTFALFRGRPPNHQTRVSPRSDGVFNITEGGIYTCRGYRPGGNFETTMSDEVIIQNTEIKATLTADITTIPPGGSVALTCSADKPAGLTFALFRGRPPNHQTRVSPRSDGVFNITEGGIYTCRGYRPGVNFETTMSDEVIIQNTEIKATLTAKITTIPPGGSVTLTCSVDKPAGLTFELFRGSPPNRQTTVSDGVFSITEGGIYICRGVITGTKFMTSVSNEVTISKTVSNTVLVSQPNWSPMYKGETITLRCEIQDDGGTEWTYDWKPTNTNSQSSTKYRIFSATEADSGEFSCMGRRGYELTGWSEAIRLTVLSHKPKATLKAEKTIVPAGGSVTLTCSVDGSSGWMFYWYRNGQHYYPVVGSSGNTEPDGTISISEGGEYSCLGGRGGRGYSIFTSETSEKVTIQKTVSKLPVIQRDKDHLECFIQEGAQWTYEWRKNKLDYNPASRIITADSGNYSCRGTSDYFLIPWSDVITLTISPNKPSLVLEPNWSQFYRGEKVTLRCEIQGGTQWTYEWRPTNRNSPTSNEYRINSATDADSGEYSCRGNRERFSLTAWSNVVKITVLSPPQPVLSVSPSWLNPGASVTLNCEVQPQDAGWRFYWYKAVPKPSNWYQKPFYSYELLPGSTSGTEQNYFIINGPTHTAGFVCRAGRGEPKIYTHFSETEFIWSADPGPAASLSVNPDRVQHFRFESVSLSCEGNSTGWRVMRFTETDGLSAFTCPYRRTTTGSKCTLIISWSDSGVFWCESKSGEFSNAVNISVHTDSSAPLLLSPVRPVTEGDPVTLSCRDKNQKLLSKVFFYHNDKILHSNSRGELNISAVSKSDEGFYKCQHSGKDSPRSWMSVRVTLTTSVSSSFPVMLIVGPVVLIILIILLLLLWHCRRSRGLRCISSKGSEIRGQSSTTNQPEGHKYRSLHHENPHLYDTIGSAEAAGNAADEHPEVTYSLIEMKSFGKAKRQGGPEEGAVYSEVKTGAADSTQAYAEIDHQKKVKKKATGKGKSGPAAAEAAVYSEIRSAPALENNAAM